MPRAVLNGDLGGLAHVLLRDAADRRGQGRGEQRDLPLRRGLLEDPLDIVDEAHLQHLVALIEHEEAQIRERRARRSSCDPSPARACRR